MSDQKCNDPVRHAEYFTVYNQIFNGFNVVYWQEKKNVKEKEKTSIISEKEESFQCGVCGHYQRMIMHRREQKMIHF